MRKNNRLLLTLLASICLVGCEKNDTSVASNAHSDKPSTVLPSDTKKSDVSSPKKSEVSTPSNVRTLTGIEASFDKENPVIGDVLTLNLNASFSDGTTEVLKDADVNITLTGDALNRDGLSFTAVKEGDAIVLVSYQGKEKSLSVHVGHVVVKSISLTDPLSTELSIGNTLQLEYSVFPAESKVIGLQFASSDEEVLSVTETGLVTALKVGTSTITVSCKNEANPDAVLSDCIDFEVKSIPVSSVTSEESFDLEQGQTHKLSYFVLPENASNKEVTFVSSDPETVSVDENGLLTGIKPGSSTITVTTKDGDFQSDTTVTVKSNYDMHEAEVVEKINKGKDVEYRSVLSYDESYSNPDSYRIKKRESHSKVYSNGTDHAHIVTETKNYKDPNGVPSEDTKSYRGISETDQKYYDFTYDNLENTMYSASASFVNGDASYESKSRYFYDSDLGYSSYGLYAIALNFISSTSYMGSSSLKPLKKWDIQEDKITLTAVGEKTDYTLYGVRYYDAELSLEFDKNNAITKLSYDYKAYYKEGYDSENHQFIDKTKAEDVLTVTIDATYGNRTADTDLEFSPDGLYFSDPEFVPEKGTKNDDGLYTLEKNSSTSLIVKDSLHPYATSKIDKIKVKSIEDESILTDDSSYSSLKLKGKATGKTTVTFVNSKNVEFTQAFAVVNPKATSIDTYYEKAGSFVYCSSSTVIKSAIGTSVRFTGKVYPNGTEQDFNLTCEDENVTIMKDEETYTNGAPIYSVTSQKAGTYELHFVKDSIDKKISVTFYDPSLSLSDDQAKTLLCSKGYKNSSYDYDLTFKADGSFSIIGDQGNLYGTYEVKGLTLSFTVTSHEKNKYFEVEADAKITINSITLDSDWNGKNLNMTMICSTSSYYSGYFSFVQAE